MMLFRTGILAVVFAAATLSGVAIDRSLAAKADQPSIEEIMEYNHSGKKALAKKVTNAVKEGKWDVAAAPAKKMKDLGAALGSNTAPKGDAGSWKKLCEAYAADTAAIAAAVEKQDSTAANAALAKLGKSCKACHEAHRE